MYLVVLKRAGMDKETKVSSSLAGLLQELNGVPVSNVMVIAGPLDGDVIEILRRAFPPENDTYIVTTKPVRPTDNKCMSIADAPLTTRMEYREPITISVVGSKGGVGKSTLCLLLALYLHQTSAADKRNVVIIDADVQAGLSCWFSDKTKGRRVTSITPDNGVLLFSSAYGEYSPAVPEIVGWYLGANWVIVDNGNIPDRAIIAPCTIMVTSASEINHPIYIEALQKLPTTVAATVVTHNRGIKRRDRDKYIENLLQVASTSPDQAVQMGRVLVLPEMEFPGNPNSLVEELSIYLGGEKKIRAVLEELAKEAVRRHEETGYRDI